MRKVVLGILFFICTSTIFATTSSNSDIPSKGLQAEGYHQWQSAIAIYLDILLKDPTRRALWLRVATIEHQLKNYPLTINAYQHAISLTPDDPALYKTLSEIYAESNQPREALVAINEAVKLKPNEVDYLIARAKIANWNKNLEITLDSYQRLYVLRQSTNSVSNELDLLGKIGDLHYQLHQYPEAITAYQKAIHLNPQNPVLYQNLSKVYASANKPENAIASIEGALRLDPNNVEYLKSKDVLEKWLNNTKSLSPEKSLHTEKPLSPFDHLIFQANEAAINHRYVEAANATKKAILLKPNDSILYKKLSEIYATAKQPQLALAAINKAISLNPTSIDYWRSKATLAAWAGDQTQTQLSYEKILKLKPLDQDALLNYAHSLAWQGKTDLAIRAYTRFLHHYPKIADGWVQYAEVLSWTARFRDALSALDHYRQLKGQTWVYRKTLARILALAGRFTSSLTINEPLLRARPKDPYVLSTEVTAQTDAFQTDKALVYLKKLNEISPNDPEVMNLNDIILTPLRSSIDIEGDYTSANDTTRIEDFPVRGQYFLTPTTSLLLQGLYERATAAPGSGLVPVNGGTSIWDQSARVGFTTQIASLNLKGLVGGLKIQGGDNHGIYDALVNTNVGETAQLTVENFRDLYRAYLVPQTPKSISLQVMETRIGGQLQWQPFIQQYLNTVLSYSNLSDNNSYVHLNVWPKSRIYGSERLLVTVGVDGDLWQFRRRATDGYYSPLRFIGYEGTVEIYYAQSKNIGYGVSAGFGLQKDETFPHYYYEEDLAAQMFFGIFTDWELQLRGGFTLRNNPIHNYNCSVGSIVLTRRF
ncbi:MAG: tetratricopeptide repeat protein [Legionellaceae bacterium]|nr:tetratricopeptide repeat protein [Legionellaceae bacterium]